MLRIRLQRPGKSVKRRYHYKIVVNERKAARESRFIAQVGYYDPSRKLLNFNISKYEVWLSKGAQPTETVATLFKKYKKKMNSE